MLFRSTASAISSVAPASGQVGTVITISGSNLLSSSGTVIEEVLLANVAATVVVNDQQDTVVATVTANDGTAATGDVYIRADTGAYATLADGWQYLAEGIVTGVTPSSGQGSTIVTIAGERLKGGGSSVVSVILGGIAAQIDSQGSSEIVVTAGISAQAVSGGSVVITSISGSIVTALNAWNYETPGVIDSVAPNQGQNGTVVTITGTSLQGHGDSVASVDLAGVDAILLSESDTEVVVVATSSGAQLGAVSLHADTGALVTLADSWTYVTLGAVTGVDPVSGQTGTRVTISGTGLRSGAEIGRASCRERV